MRSLLKIATVVYVLILIGCTIVFFTQRSVVYGDHIRPGRQIADEPIAVRMTDSETGQVTEAELTLVNDYIATNPLSMANEIEEHLTVLLFANVATGVLLLLVTFAASRNAEPAGALDGDSAAASSPQVT